MENLLNIGDTMESSSPWGAACGGASGADLKALEGMIPPNMSPEELRDLFRTYEDAMQQPESMLNKVDPEGGVLIKPTPGFVIKTRLIQGSQSGTKVFLNVCSDSHVEKPHQKSLEDVGVQGSENQVGVRVPLSVGTPVEDFDNKKEPCLTVDLIANPDTVAEATESAEFKQMVVQLCMAAVEQKYSWRLDPKIKLPRLKYKGPVQLQRVKVTKQRNIEEVGGTRNGKVEEVSSSSASTATATPSNQPEFSVYYAPRGTEPTLGPQTAWQNAFDLPCYQDNFGRNLQEKGWMSSEKSASQQKEEIPDDTDWLVHVSLPTICNVQKMVQVAISDEAMQVSFPKSSYAPLTLWWPRLLDSTKATSWFTDGSLYVTLPTASTTPCLDVLDNSTLLEVF